MEEPQQTRYKIYYLFVPLYLDGLVAAGNAVAKVDEQGQYDSGGTYY
jgi:hypothetical protein